THFLAAGMPLENISQFLGHTSLESTQIYTHLQQASGRQAHLIAVAKGESDQPFKNIPTYDQADYQKMNEAIKHYLEAKEHTKKTIQSELRDLNQYLEWLHEEGIEPEEAGYTDLLAYMKHLNQRGISQRTIQVYINTLKHFYSHLLEEKIIT